MSASAQRVELEGLTPPVSVLVRQVQRDADAPDAAYRLARALDA